MLEFAAPLAITHQQKPELRIASDEPGCEGQKVVVSFEFEEASDLANNDVSRIQAQLQPQLGIVFRTQERLDIEAAENFRISVRPANPCCNVLSFHRVGDDNEMRGDPAGKFFGCAEEGVRHGTSKCSEGRPVYGMNDDGDFCASGR